MSNRMAKIKNLIATANKLDSAGYYKEADALDQRILKIAEMTDIQFTDEELNDGSAINELSTPYYLQQGQDVEAARRDVREQRKQYMPQLRQQLAQTPRQPGVPRREQQVALTGPTGVDYSKREMRQDLRAVRPPGAGGLNAPSSPQQARGVMSPQQAKKELREQGREYMSQIRQELAQTPRQPGVPRREQQVAITGPNGVDYSKKEMRQDLRSVRQSLGKGAPVAPQVAGTRPATQMTPPVPATAPVEPQQARLSTPPTTPPMTSQRSPGDFASMFGEKPEGEIAGLSAADQARLNARPPAPSGPRQWSDES